MVKRPQIVATVIYTPHIRNSDLDCPLTKEELFEHLSNYFFPSLSLYVASSKILKPSLDNLSSSTEEIEVMEYLLYMKIDNKDQDKQFSEPDYTYELTKLRELQNIPIKDREYFLLRGISINFQRNDVFYHHKRLVVFDMDSTLIKQECIDELADCLGKKDEVSAITELAMQGQLDFKSSLERRVALLKGAPLSIIEEVKKKIEFTPGAIQLCHCLKVLGYKLAVVSGGFLPLANYVKDTLNLDYAVANELEVSSDGLTLTGKTLGSIVTAETKEAVLRELTVKHSLNLQQVMAIGDGANDLLMMEAAGLGVAFNAKAKVQEKAQVCLNNPNLLGVMHLLGFTISDIRQLLTIS